MKHERPVADTLTLVQDVLDEQSVQVRYVVQEQSVGRRLSMTKRHNRIKNKFYMKRRQALGSTSNVITQR